MTSIDLDFEDLELEPVSTGTGSTRGVVCLHTDTDSESWYLDQASDLNAATWGAPLASTTLASDETSVVEWAEAAATYLRSKGELPVNLIACGNASLGAMLLAAEHPNLITSLILGDPEANVSSTLFKQTLKRIQTPSLVIAAAPQKDTDIAIPQSIAGGISNGVFVIIDDCAVPAHQQKPRSFNEWTSSFIRIAEGLHSFGQPQEENHA